MAEESRQTPHQSPSARTTWYCYMRGHMLYRLVSHQHRHYRGSPAKDLLHPVPVPRQREQFKVSRPTKQIRLDTSLLLHLNSILALCLRYCIIQFLHGILIPIYKKLKDPEAASSYRPVTLSVVMTKILELYILDVCQTHTPLSPVWICGRERHTYGHFTGT